MNLRLLGIFAMLGAPFLFISYLTLGTTIDSRKTPFDGFCSFLYISSWMCSITGLWKTAATGTRLWGRMVLLLQLLFLSLANVSNAMRLLETGVGSRAYFILDLFWPVSNIWMLATAVMVLLAKRLQGWMRYVPLTVVFWLPVTMVLLIVSDKATMALWGGGLFSAVALTVLGYVVYRMGTATTFSKGYAVV